MNKNPLLSKRKSFPYASLDGIEIDSKVVPFKLSLVRQFVDPKDFTFAVIREGCDLSRVLYEHTTDVWTDSSFIMVETGHNDVDSDSDSESDTDDDERENKEDKKKVKKPITSLHPALGVHAGTFKDEPIYLLVQQEGTPQGTEYSVKVKQSYILFCPGRGRGQFLRDFMDGYLRKEFQKPKKCHFQVFRWNHCRGYWRRASTEKARPMDSVILPDGIKESVEADMQRFLSKETRKWYRSKGIPYKRCYMFYGTPGTGKTSLITALAGRFRRKVCFLSAHHPKFTDEALKSALSQVPARAIVVLEDIDSLFDKNRNTNNMQNPLTFTGLLNALDGIGEHTGTLFIMTTNFIDRLDSALIRAGRVDMKVEFKKADDNQLTWMFKWFYNHTPEEAEELAPAFVKEVRKVFREGTTMAELQQHFVDNMWNDAKTCVATVKNYDLPLIQKLQGEDVLSRKLEGIRRREAKNAKKAKKDDKAEPELSTPLMRRAVSR